MSHLFLDSITEGLLGGKIIEVELGDDFRIVVDRGNGYKYEWRAWAELERRSQDGALIPAISSAGELKKC